MSPTRRDGGNRPGQGPGSRPTERGRRQRPSSPKPYRGRPSGGDRPAARTSWDPIADWYIGWVGEDGSKHHRLLAIPAVMDALAPRRGERILDVGCGHGVLAGRVLDAGASYTGVDASPRLIEHARRSYGKGTRFLIGDALKLSHLRDLSADHFDGAVFLLSLQDMDPLDDALAGAAWALRPGGRLVLLLTHPCFRVPRQSGWGWDEGRKLRYRRVDRYMTPLPVPLKSYGGPGGGATRSFHRPLEQYVNGLAAAGLVVDHLREIPTYKTVPSGAQSSAINLAHAEFPLFLAIRARKPPLN